VVIGAGAKILGQIEIGDHCYVGANAVVRTSVPAGCIAVGVPAIIKERVTTTAVATY
jgi:serine O-acetyltransferase